MAVPSNTVNNNMVDKDIIYYIVGQPVQFIAEGLKPNTRVYPFFDEVDVALYCKPAGGNLGEPLITNSNGTVAGQFDLPNNTDIKFMTGERLFTLTDSSTNSPTSTTTFAEYRFSAIGAVSKGDGVASTRSVIVRRNSLGDNILIKDPITEQLVPNMSIGNNIKLDCLSQTFVVDPIVYNSGVALSSLELFFARKDLRIPITIEIRPTVNGFPHSSIVIPLSQVTLSPNQIFVSNDGSLATTIVFESPITLEPGTYAICLITNSGEYDLFAAIKGDNVYNSQRLVTNQPFVDKIFLPQNAGNYNGTNALMLKFNLNRCAFSQSGTVTFSSEKPVSDVEYDTIDFAINDLNVSQMNLKCGIKTKDLDTGNIDTNFTQFEPNDNYDLDSRKVLSSTQDDTLSIQIDMETPNDAVSPVLDLNRMSAILVANNINDDASGENSAVGGTALARYITKRVTLNDGFDADSIRVIIDAYKSSQNNIKIYCKVQSAEDADLFENKNWIEIPQVTNIGVSAAEGQMREYQFALNDITYQGFDNFKYFAIKIVLLSTSKEDVPLVTNLRAMALKSI